MTYVRRGSALLILLGVLTLIITWRMGTQHWLGYHTGSLNTPGSPPNYNFWSGFGSDLGEYTIAAGLLGHLVTSWRTHTCHRYWWCWRAPRYALDGTPFCLCSKHHPDEQPTVAEAVEQYQAGQAAA
jgi:hypothetical protein